MKRRIKAVFFGVCLAVFVATAGQVQAGLIVNFPSSLSTTTAGGGNFFFEPAHTVFETFSDTGLASVDHLALMLNVEFNLLKPGAFVIFDVFLNGSSVGAFTINHGDPLGTLNRAFAFPSIAEGAGGETYTILLGVRNTVPAGLGSVSFFETNSTATFNGTAVPEPSSFALFGIGACVAGLGSVRRRRR